MLQSGPAAVALPICMRRQVRRLKQNARRCGRLLRRLSAHQRAFWRAHGHSAFASAPTLRKPLTDSQ
jgi:hypothetical protein